MMKGWVSRCRIINVCCLEVGTLHINQKTKTVNTPMNSLFLLVKTIPEYKEECSYT